MRAKTPTMKLSRGMLRMAMLDRHKMKLRRSVNRNAHIITPHGKVMAGRKGRKG